jgi:hypothetical protein
MQQSMPLPNNGSMDRLVDHAQWWRIYKVL